MNIKSNKSMALAMGCVLGAVLPALAQVGSSTERGSGRDHRSSIHVGTEAPSSSSDLAPNAGPTCSGDLDGSGAVDTDDLAMVLDRYGRCRRCLEDINGDTYVDSRDLALVLAFWGSCDAERPEDSTSLTTDRSVALAVVSAVVGYESDPEAPLAPGKGVRFIATNEETLGEEPEMDSTHPGKGARLIATVEESADEELAVPISCEGDLNADGQVDAADLAMMLGSGVRRCKSCSEDFNHDTYINAIDFSILLGAWGPCAE